MKLWREAVEADEDRFLELWRLTHGAMFAALPAQLAGPLVRQQYDAQKAGYLSRHPGHRSLALLGQAGVAGRLLLDEQPTHLTVLDILIDPSEQGSGLGTSVLRAMQEAAGTRELRLMVLRTNAAAMRLYERLGFRRTGETPTHLALCWTLASA